MTPINKKAALFLSRKPRIETLPEALEAFAAKICGPDVAGFIASAFPEDARHDRASVSITLAVMRDLKTEDRFCVTLKTKMTRDLGSEGFFGLNSK